MNQPLPACILNLSMVRLILGESKLLVTFIESGRVSRDVPLEYREQHLGGERVTEGALRRLAWRMIPSKTLGLWRS